MSTAGVGVGKACTRVSPCLPASLARVFPVHLAPKRRIADVHDERTLTCFGARQILCVGAHHDGAVAVRTRPRRRLPQQGEA